MPRKKFKRYYTGSANRSSGSGKGSDRREPDVPDEQVAQNWCKAFGHTPRKHDATHCRDCGEPIGVE